MYIYIFLSTALRTHLPILVARCCRTYERAKDTCNLVVTASALFSVSVNLCV